MIKVFDFLWQRINQYGQKYLSGQVVVDAFNTALTEVQTEVYTDLSPYYQTNEKIRGILQPWVKKATGTAANSLFTIDDTKGIFDRIVSLAVTATGDPTTILFEINPIMEGELVYANRIPQRAPNFAQKRVYYLMESQSTVADIDAEASIRLAPNIATLDYLAYYLVYPYEAKIAFILSETDDEDIMTYDPTESIDLAWGMDAANLILYKMLEKYGVNTREQWLLEYAKLGLSETMVSGGKAA